MMEDIQGVRQGALNEFTVQERQQMCNSAINMSEFPSSYCPRERKMLSFSARWPFSGPQRSTRLSQIVLGLGGAVLEN